jgi:hypothetical protein
LHGFTMHVHMHRVKSPLHLTWTLDKVDRHL